MKRLLLLGLGLSFFSSLTMAQCLTAPNGEYPGGVFVPTTCDGTTQNSIDSDCWAGEYTTVGLISGNSYVFSSSIGTDFITISDELGTTALVFGTGSVNYTAASSGNYRFYTHVDVACGDDQNSRERIVVCTGSAGCVSGNGPYPSADFTPAVCDGTTTNDIAVDCYAGEYSNVVLSLGNEYIFESSNPNDLITITDASGSNVLSVGIGFAYYLNVSASETVRFYTHTDLDCGAESVDRTRSVLCLSNGGGGVGCTNAPFGKYPASDITISVCDGTPQIISSVCYAGEYSTVFLEGGHTYGFESSVATDWITLVDSLTGTIIGSGQTPITDLLVSGGSGFVLFYTHTDEFCGDEMVERSRIVTCEGNVGIDELDAMDISVYPNPADHIISIAGEVVFERIELLSPDGRVLFSLRPNSTAVDFDLSPYAAGVYFLRIRAEGKTIVKEFIKN